MASDDGAGKQLHLHSYWMSSCSQRVRIGLNLKGLEYEYKTLTLLKGGQKSPEFLKLNPPGYVPVLVDGDAVVADSFAILLYLEEKFPQRPLLPQDLQKKAINYQVANVVGSSIQPYQNPPIIRKTWPDQDVAWGRERILKGFIATLCHLLALEKLLKDYAGKYAAGDEVYLADLFLAPQIDSAIRRFKIDMNEFPLLCRINEAYSELPAFQDASPGRQPDAPPDQRS